MYIYAYRLGFKLCRVSRVTFKVNKVSRVRVRELVLGLRFCTDNM